MEHGERQPTWTVRSGQDLGRAIADIRSRRGLTQQQVADKVGLTRGYLAKIETGRSVTLLDHLLRILRRLGATVTITLTKPDNGSA